jgi:beta-N-acetylhexosaminidase
MLSRREFLASLALLPAMSGRPRPAARGKELPAGVSIEEMIGQMIMVGFRGLTLEAGNPVLEDIRERRIGGVVLFDVDVPSGGTVRNIQSPEQVRALTAALRETSDDPLLIGIDQEGGKISRLKEKYGFPPSVSARFLGSLDDPAVTRKAAAATAGLLAEYGFNINFAPVVDLDLNPLNPVIGGLERSYSADPAVVVRQALEVIRAHRAAGVLTTLKHFPGHGSSRDDSHAGFVDVTGTWSRKELEPYARIIEAGACDAVMTAHIFDADLDPSLPATLSPRIITGILRGDLGWDGVVISDDMQMKAVSANYGFEEAVRRAVDAGVDILMFANNSTFDPGVAGKAVSAIGRAVREGTIPEERIELSYRRIHRLKDRLSPSEA